MATKSYATFGCSICNSILAGEALDSNGICLLCNIKCEIETRELCEALPFYILPGQDDLLEVLNPFGYSQLKLVPSNVTVGTTFNLDMNEQPRRMNSEDIDPDVNLYNEVLSGAQYVTPSALAPKIVSHGNLPGILHINGRSILSKMQEFQLLVVNIPVSFVALTETWTNKNTEDQLKLKKYTAVYSSREDRIGGGVAIMVRENIKYWPLDLGISPKHNTYESIFIQVQQIRGPALVIGVIYRPPGQSLSDFNDEISILVSVLSKSKRNLILVGDFNIDLLKISTNGPTQTFMNILTAEFIAPVINCPTRITEFTATLIDNIFTNIVQDVIDPFVIVSDLSDHFPE